MTRLRVEPRSFDQGRRKNNAFTHSATLPIKYPIVSIQPKDAVSDYKTSIKSLTDDNDVPIK